MAKFNADDESLFEPIEITLGGKDYKIERITTAMISLATSGVKKEEEKDIELLCKQVSVFLGGDPTDFEGIDVRRLGAVLSFITEEIKSCVEGIKSKKA